MSAQQNMALARKAYDLFGTKQYDRILELATPDVEIVLFSFGQTFRGHQGFTQFMSGFGTAFPDMTLQVTNQVATEQQVVSEFVARGTHTGPLMTPGGAIAPTGRRVELTVCEVWEISGGKLARLRNYLDSATLLRQLGLLAGDEHKAAARRIPEEVFNQGNLAAADALFAADYVEHEPLPPGMPTGLPGLKQFVTTLRAAFPDFRYTVDDLLAEGDKVVVRVTARGTHRGEFLGVAPTGKQATWTETHVARMAGGKLVEHWADSDRLGLLQQLGAIPAGPGQTGR